MKKCKKKKPLKPSDWIALALLVFEVVKWLVELLRK